MDLWCLWTCGACGHVMTVKHARCGHPTDTISNKRFIPNKITEYVNATVSTDEHGLTTLYSAIMTHSAVGLAETLVGSSG